MTCQKFDTKNKHVRIMLVRFEACILRIYIEKRWNNYILASTKLALKLRKHIFRTHMMS